MKLPPEGFERLAQRIRGYRRIWNPPSQSARIVQGSLSMQALLEVCASFTGPRFSRRHGRSCRQRHHHHNRRIHRRGAREATRDGAPAIELIDGEGLLDMLEELELGLTPVTTFEVEHQFFREFAA
jgi:restriction system protein